MTSTAEREEAISKATHVGARTGRHYIWSGRIGRLYMLQSNNIYTWIEHIARRDFRNIIQDGILVPKNTTDTLHYTEHEIMYE